MTFELRELGELYAVPSRNGVAPPKSSRGEGVPMVNMGDLFAHARICGHEMERVPLTDRERERALLEPGDLLFARRSLKFSGAGACSIFCGSDEPTTFESSLIRVRVDRNAACPDYLFYLFRSPVGRVIMETIIEQTAVAGIKASVLARLKIPLPSLAEQRRIASVLKALDDKIDSNRRLAQLLEQIAQTEFEARLVDFIGVDGFVDSEIGPLPKGWLVRPLLEAVDINPRVPIAKSQVTPFVAMANVAPWATRPDVVGERPFSGGCRFEPGDTLMARITGCIEHGKGAFVDFIDGPGAGSTEFLVLRAREPLTPEAVFFLCRTERFRSHAIANMTGSSGRQRVQISALRDFKLATPPDRATWADTAELLRSVLRQTRELWSETRTHISIRDALLPKLISGQIRVPDTTDPGEVIEPLVDEAA
jgi:type I restriction enzyme S subunit